MGDTRHCEGAKTYNFRLRFSSRTSGALRGDTGAAALHAKASPTRASVVAASPVRSSQRREDAARALPLHCGRHHPPCLPAWPAP